MRFDLARARALLFEVPRTGKLAYCLMRDRRVPLGPKVAVGTALGLIVSPLDVPAWVPVIGDLDVLALRPGARREHLRPRPAARAHAGARGRPAPARRSSRAAPTVGIPRIGGKRPALKIMLTKDVANIGLAGDVKDVADGYGRNYLLPRKLAVLAGKGAEAEARRLREATARREAKERDEARELAELIDNKTVVVRLKVGAEDKVFGAITNDDVATALRLQHQVDVDRRKIDIKDPLKQLGEHQVPLRLHREVTANINLIITQDR
ncbi:MAG: 50S ribosomal protein L9 [Chloroflexi bacterium]|nr:MAG: 50S ribosomal protein L9 [Chloroflexota bacterium]